MHNLGARVQHNQHIHIHVIVSLNNTRTFASVFGTNKSIRTSDQMRVSASHVNVAICLRARSLACISHRRPPRRTLHTRAHGGFPADACQPEHLVGRLRLSAVTSLLGNRSLRTRHAGARGPTYEIRLRTCVSVRANHMTEIRARYIMGRRTARAHCTSANHIRVQLCVRTPSPPSDVGGVRCKLENMVNIINRCIALCTH